MRKLGYVLALGCLLAGANGAFAGLAVVGDPIPSNSWSQLFNESGVGNFDQMVVQNVSGSLFEAPTFTGMAGGWTNVGGTTAAWASGGDQMNMYFYINFSGTESAVTFNFWALDNGVEKEAAQAYYPGSGGYGAWVINPLVDAAPPTNPVPEPLTMASAFFVIAGLGGYIRRRTGRAVA